MKKTNKNNKNTKNAKIAKMDIAKLRPICFAEDADTELVRDLIVDKFNAQMTPKMAEDIRQGIDLFGPEFVSCYVECKLFPISNSRNSDLVEELDRLEAPSWDWAESFFLDEWIGQYGREDGLTVWFDDPDRFSLVDGKIVRTEIA